MIAGGAEAAINELSLAGFGAMKALSTRNDAPEKASRPFDVDRDGFVMAEGAGILILEEMEHALARGARVHAEIAGFGMSGDAFHLTAPDPQGQMRAMKAALDMAGEPPEAVDYINAHATGTGIGDRTETAAIKVLFGAHAYRLAVSANKSMIGHLFGAAGGVEAVATIRTITDGVIPPTINLDRPDPECDLDYVPNVAKRRPVRVALSNGFGFGGHNDVLLFRRFEA
jgi:3-oxoacyl-[acyl-carrier-protein] synthase II